LTLFADGRQLILRNKRDSRLELIEAALETAKSYERNLRLRLLSINIAAAGLEVKNPTKGLQQDPLDDGLAFGTPPSSRRGRTGQLAHMV
jgi:hypothetical protein